MSNKYSTGDVVVLRQVYVPCYPQMMRGDLSVISTDRFGVLTVRCPNGTTRTVSPWDVETSGLANGKS